MIQRGRLSGKAAVITGATGGIGEIASAALYLASSDSSFITGQSLSVASHDWVVELCRRQASHEENHA
jgi:NAD(P)-dependent dehydrogenase (short-subunit alcohol dehydrogenase family)